ncbi:MAG: S-layer homology domain-containing protein [Clostridia bacterium]|nr:S-layer homology domain-containing protein [Clostridia bacterium]
MKKLLVFPAVLTAVLLSLVLPAAAVYTISPESEIIRSYQQVYEAIYQAIDAQQSYLDVSRWKVQDYDIMTIFTDVMQNSPEFFYADQKLAYRYNQNGIVTSLSFTYNMSRTKRNECMAYYEQEISYIVNEVEAYRLTEPEIALYVHDYLISSYEYDSSESIYDVYGFLKERKGVCQAYSLCYMAIMRELGIPCYMVVSEEMNHSWNLVNIDNQWYHVDLVYDDPQPNRPGQVLHQHFLLSDDAISEDHGQGKHWGWSSRIPCTDNTYNQKYWQSCETRMLYMNDTWYYIDESSRMLYRSYFNGHSKRALYTLVDYWYVDLSAEEPAVKEQSARWKGLFTGLSTYNGYLFFNGPDSIWRFNPASGDREELLLLDEGGLNIYGTDIFKNRMEYLVGDTPDRTTTSYIETLPMLYTEVEMVVENVFLPFTDVTRVSPYYEAVEYLYEAGIMQGMSETQFDLNSSMTRAQFAALLSRLYKYDPADYGGEILYTDVSPRSWYAPYVAWVTESGYMNGMGGGRFAPDDPVTREQMLTILASVGRSLKIGSAARKELKTIDRTSVSPWAVSGVDYCYANGLIADKYLYALSPAAYVKRSEIADVLYRFCQLQG